MRTSLPASAPKSARVSMDKKPRRYQVVTLGIALLVLALAGCGAGRPIKYYQLSYPPAVTPSQDAVDATIMVRSFQASPLYVDNKIVYGFDGPEMGTYSYQRWAQAPIGILQDALVRGLRASGQFKAVFDMRSDVNGRYILAGQLYDFKEVDLSPMVARLNYEVRMRDRNSNTIVWSHIYSHDEPASEKSINAFVQAMDKNVQRSVQEIQAGLGEYFRTHPSK